MSDHKEVAIAVKHVHKDFILPQHKHSSFKQLAVNIVRENNKTTQHVLDDVSFEINKGDFFAIVGRNGSGKSTLLKLLAGVYVPTEGNIEINGSLTPFIELGVGFNPELSGRDNVFLNGALLGFTRKEMNAMYDDIVEFAELEAFMDQKLKNYSSGMQVRLAFSIAVRAQGDILLLDEVLAVGDAAFQQKCFNYFEELKRRKQTVVFVSHDMAAIQRFCNKAIYLKEGKIIFEGDTAKIADIYAEENIQAADLSDPNDSLEGKLSSTHKLSSKILDRDNKRLTLEFSYKADDDQEMYIGMSLQRQGASIAEITTLEGKALIGRGCLTYTLDLTTLNPGPYQVGAGLYLRKNRELVAISQSRCSFVVKGSDDTRGGALKLEDAWQYGKD